MVVMLIDGFVQTSCNLTWMSIYYVLCGGEEYALADKTTNCSLTRLDMAFWVFVVSTLMSHPKYISLFSTYSEVHGTEGDITLSFDQDAIRPLATV